MVDREERRNQLDVQNPKFSSNYSAAALANGIYFQRTCGREEKTKCEKLREQGKRMRRGSPGPGHEGSRRLFRD
jgi:hypothetical protein